MIKELWVKETIYNLIDRTGMVDNFTFYKDYVVLKFKNLDSIKLKFEVCPYLSNSVIANIAGKKDEKPMILISKYVNPVIAEKLKEQGINYVDSAGNCLISSDGILIHISGNKNLERTSKKVEGYFNITDIKVAFALLAAPEIFNDNQRKIALYSKSALGPVNLSLRKLTAQKFIMKTAKGLMLTNKDRLFEKWCVSFSDKLLHKLHLGTFRGSIAKNGKNIDGLWGGDTGAYFLNKFIKSVTNEIFIKKNELKDFLLTNRLVKDPEGSIEIYDASWIDDDILERYRPVIHPFVIYAQLLSTGDQRNIEGAKLIYEKFIAEKLK
ncbi:MAG TPA: type IV toxin-antitoxin system AbiEi family antitoxin [Clostridiales bacterium]|jgi:hypothetical protein|nr:type IV toxin-antitoxin system AbiEi family antitoxin [Clostridiales bacterium]HQP68989.1 type IV toxin-antitoxin system AbiEi family antitoxin [Clostridiales bacterium]